MTPEELMEIQGIGDKTIDRIRRVVTEYFEKGQEELEQAALEEEQPPSRRCCRLQPNRRQLNRRQLKLNRPLRKPRKRSLRQLKRQKR